MDSKYPAHGTYDGRIDGRLLISTHGGAWNVEMFQKAARTAMPYIRELNAGGPWGTLIVLDTLLNHPDVFIAGRNWVVSAEVSKMVAVAWVISPDLDGYNSLIDRYRQLYEGLIQTAVFPTIEKASAWVYSKIMEKSDQNHVDAS